jgi:predicted Na+-dependent transporter
MKLARNIDISIIILMVIFASVQFNDEDGIIWMAAYLSVAVIAIMHFMGKASKSLNRSLLVLYILVLSYYIPQLVAWFGDGMPSIIGSMKAETPYIELVREAGGIFICGLLMLYYTTRKY